MELKFERMEWWDNPNPDGLGQAVVGFTQEGETYLTFDIRNRDGDLMPVFSPICKVEGGKDCFTRKAYEFYRSQFMTLKGYEIYPVDVCTYSMKNTPHIKVKFKNHD